MYFSMQFERQPFSLLESDAPGVGMHLSKQLLLMVAMRVRAFAMACCCWICCMICCLTSALLADAEEEEEPLPKREDILGVEREGMGMGMETEAVEKGLGGRGESVLETRGGSLLRNGSDSQVMHRQTLHRHPAPQPGPATAAGKRRSSRGAEQQTGKRQAKCQLPPKLLVCRLSQTTSHKACRPLLSHSVLFDPCIHCSSLLVVPPPLPCISLGMTNMFAALCALLGVVSWRVAAQSAAESNWDGYKSVQV